MIARRFCFIPLALVGLHLACGGGGYGSSSSGPSAGTVLASDKRIQVQAGGTQSTATGTAFPTALVVKVYSQDTVSNGDGYGGTHTVITPLSSVTVTFTITAGTGGASGSFPGPAATATAVTDMDGLATAPALTANGVAGTFTVAATAPGAAQAATFTLTNL